MGCTGKQIACAYIIYLNTFDSKKLSEAWVAMVIVNVHVFDFLIHLSKLAFCDISFKYPLKFKKKPLNPGFFKKTHGFFQKTQVGWVFCKKPGFYPTLSRDDSYVTTNYILDSWHRLVIWLYSSPISDSEVQVARL